MSIQQLTQQCPNCGRMFPTKAHFCDACGKALQPVSPAGIGGSLPRQSGASPTLKPVKPLSSTVQPQPTTQVKGHIVGEARNVQYRTESNPKNFAKSWNIWTFVVERYEAGNRLTPVAVEMRSHRSFEGFINEGDRVEIPGGWKGSGTLRPDKVYDATTRSFFKAKKPRLGGWGIFFLILSWVIGLIPFILYLSNPESQYYAPGLGVLVCLLLPVLVTVVDIFLIVRRSRQ